MAHGKGIRRKLHCIGCGDYIGLAGRAHRNVARCIDCDAERRKLLYAAKMDSKPKPHDLAFLMVIRSRYDAAALYKSNAVPDGYDLVYAAPYGCLLPRKYAKLPAFIPKL
jgi:hypothetical protein